MTEEFNPTKSLEIHRTQREAIAQQRGVNRSRIMPIMQKIGGESLESGEGAASILTEHTIIDPQGERGPSGL